MDMINFGKNKNSFYSKRVKFWRKKKVLITGHSGFKGTWLTLMLSYIGVNNIYGIALKKNSNSFFKKREFNGMIKTFYCDINDYKKLASIIKKLKPEITFNFAAQSLVSEGYISPLKTFNTNILGSINVLHAIKNTSPLSTIIMATTDKVYKTKYKKYFTEKDELGGHDPYSASKASLEILINQYIHRERGRRENRRLGIASCRTGNVIGGGDFSKNRIIPDIFRAIKNKKKLKVRFKTAVRPWQHVFDPLLQYILLAEKIHQDKRNSGNYNFGPGGKNQVTVAKIINIAQKRFKNLKIKFIKNQIKETKYLMLNTKKISKTLNIKNILSLNKSLKLTFDWYENFIEGKDMVEFSKKQIQKFLTF